VRRVALLVLALVLVACGDDDDVAAAALDGRDYLSTAVEGRSLVPGTQIRLSFTDGQVGAQAGCNSLGAPYEVVDDHLVIGGGLSMTEMGCDAERHAQDEWLADLLGAGPVIAVESDELTLTSTDATVRLLDRRVADPDRPLTGTRWRVDTVLSGDAASSVPDAGAVTLEIGDDALTATSAGCASVVVGMQVDGDRLHFGPASVDDVACPPPWASVLEVLGTGEATWSITAARLTITAGEIGISAVADES
jgi:heat shock protein HslJ